MATYDSLGKAVDRIGPGETKRIVGDSHALATARRLILRAPAFSTTIANWRAVVPVVITSSTISTWRHDIVPRDTNALLRFLARSLALKPD